MKNKYSSKQTRQQEMKLTFSNNNGTEHKIYESKDVSRFYCGLSFAW